MPFIEVKDDRLYYESYGKGRPLVLIHSAWASHEWWQWQVPDLSRGYQVFLYDVRGHGQSTPLRDVFSVEGFTKDLEIFLQRLQIDETVLIGWSMGGIIAMQNCLDHPTKVKALILIATSGHRIPGLKLRIYSHYLQALLSLLMDFAQPRKYDRSAQQFPQQNLWLEHQVRNMLSPLASKEVFDWVLTDIRDNPRENFFTVIKSLWNWEAGNKLRQIKVPTLIMAGQDDTLAPPRFSQLLHDTIPNSRLRIIENTSHYLVLERPELVNAEILKFLKEIGY
ncbi:MAG: alpha/beta hydrolase [Desulfobacterales bacterium]|nr:MAG: alpha/beta hydrolase [Desulfobacterales bacterium]